MCARADDVKLRLCGARAGHALSLLAWSYGVARAGGDAFWAALSASAATVKFTHTSANNFAAGFVMTGKAAPAVALV